MANDSLRDRSYGSAISSQIHKSFPVQGVTMPSHMGSQSESPPKEGYDPNQPMEAPQYRKDQGDLPVYSDKLY
jgi:hypothetical protein